MPSGLIATPVAPARPGVVLAAPQTLLPWLAMQPSGLRVPLAARAKLRIVPAAAPKSPWAVTT